LLTKRELEIPSVAWQSMLGRIKGFRSKLHLSNIAYKYFIDDVFDKFFTNNGYIPTFGAIVSEKVYNIVKKKSIYNFEDIEKLRDDLYKNNLLFSKITCNLNHKIPAL